MALTMAVEMAILARNQLRTRGGHLSRRLHRELGGAARPQAPRQVLGHSYSGPDTPMLVAEKIRAACRFRLTPFLGPMARNGDAVRFSAVTRPYKREAPRSCGRGLKSRFRARNAREGANLGLEMSRAKPAA